MTTNKYVAKSEAYWNENELERFRLGMKTDTGAKIAPFVSPEGWLTWKDGSGFFSIHVLTDSGFLGKCELWGDRISFIDSYDRVRANCCGKVLTKFADLPVGVSE